MALTQVSTGGIKDATVATADIADNAVTTAKIAGSAVSTGAIADNAVTTAKIAGSAVTSGALADQAVTLAKLEHGTSSNNGKFLRANNGADPTFETVNTDITGDLAGGLNSNGYNLNFADSNGSNNQAKFGDSGDLAIYHDNAHSRIVDTGTGDLSLQTSKLNIGNAANSEAMAVFTENGSVDLYYDNIKQLETFHASTVGHSPSGGSDITGGGVKTTRTNSKNSNIGYYCYKDSNLVARLTNHGSGPEGILQLYNQGVPKLSMNGTNGTLTLHGTAGYIQFGDTNSASHRLDDYEEGTYNPTMTGYGSTSNFTLHGGEDTLSYVKIGNNCWITGRIRIDNDTYSGYVRMTLPFTSAQGTDCSNCGMSAVATHGVTFSDSIDKGLFFETYANTTMGVFVFQREDTGWTNATNAHINSNNYITFNHYYITA